MKIYYQGIAWAYSHNVSNIVNEKLGGKYDLEWKPNFDLVWQELEKDKTALWVLPIENSYAWSVHANLYNFLRHNNMKIIWEYTLSVNHCLWAKTDNIKDIRKVFSHPQAVAQCHNFLRKNNIEWNNFADTSAAAKMVWEWNDNTIAAIASKQACAIYWLNILEEKIQDQDGNRTRFFVVTSVDNEINYSDKQKKVSIIFETKHEPAVLYKCLWCFATNRINLTKIESLPSLKNPFTYMFWIDFEGELDNEWVKYAMNELKYYTTEINILWKY